jgi:hypothetical protein
MAVDTRETEAKCLDPQSIQAALVYLTDSWPHHSMTAAVREAWEDVLTRLRPGELKPALAKVRGRFRPDPYPILELVLASRPKPAPKPHVPVQHESVRIDPDSIPEVLEAKRKLGLLPPEAA